MIKLEKRIKAISGLRVRMEERLAIFKAGKASDFKVVSEKARVENPWFTSENVVMAFQNWIEGLSDSNLEKWTKPYLERLSKERPPLTVGVINAGNIPFVGLHDLLSVIITGNQYLGKNASDDSFLLPYVASILFEAEPELKEHIRFAPRLEGMNAIIATGNNNSARYFEYYFGKYPHIIRKNRNGVAVLNGNETKEQIESLGSDIFRYFGLGCRNISKIYVPEKFEFKDFFEPIFGFNGIMMHNKYMNNFEYHNSVLLLKQIPFLQNGFLIVREEKQIPSPIAVLHYEKYSGNIEEELLKNIDNIQCIASAGKFSNEKLEKIRVDFGKTQSPQLWDYADGVDTVEFLLTVH